MKKFVLIASVVLVVAIVAIACAPAPTPAPPAATSAPVVQTVIVAGTPQQVIVTATPPPGTPAPTLPPPPAIKNPDTLVVAESGEPESLDPAWDYETAGGEIVQQVYQPLVFYNREAVDKFIGMLATDWKTSSDGLTWTFNIRKNVKFHNGDPMSPSDVAYSYVRGFIQSQASGPQWIMLQPFYGPSVTGAFLDPGVKPGDSGDDVVNSMYKGDFVAACTAAQKMIVADNNAGTVTMTLKQPWGPFLASIANAWGSVLDQKWIAAQGGWTGNCADFSKPDNIKKWNNPESQASELFDKMNGTGPFMLGKWDKGKSITLDANPNYWQTQPLWDGGPSGAPKLNHVVLNYISEWGTRFAMMTTGDADLLYVPNNFYAQIDPLVKDQCDGNGANCKTVNAKGFLRMSRDLPGVQQADIFFNQKVNTTGGNTYIGSGKLDGNGIPPNFFSNVHIRKAFAACFDYDTFIKQTLNGEALQPNGPNNPGSLGYDPNGAKQKFSLDTCKSEFDAAAKDPGFENVVSKGFYVIGVYNAGNTTRQSALQLLASNLKQVNSKFTLSILAEPFAVEIPDSNAGRLPLFVLGWLEDYHDPNDWVGPYLATGGNYSGPQSFDPVLQKQLDALVNQGISTVDPAARAKVYAQLNVMAVDNALDIFMSAGTNRHYEQPWVKGWYYNPIYSGAPIAGYYYAYSKGQ